MTITAADRTRVAKPVQATASAVAASLIPATRARTGVAIDIEGAAPGEQTADITAAIRTRAAQAIQATADAITASVTAAARTRQAQAIQATGAAALADVAPAERARVAMPVQMSMDGAQYATLSAVDLLRSAVDIQATYGALTAGGRLRIRGAPSLRARGAPTLRGWP